MKSTTQYKKVGDHRGNPRIWIQTLRLLDMGLAPGAPYTVNYDDKTSSVHLIATPDGDRSVSYKTTKLKSGSYRSPVIDLNSSELAVLGDVARVRVTLKAGAVAITPHHEDVAQNDREASLIENVKSGFVTTGTLCAGAGISTAAVSDGLKLGGLNSRTEFVVEMDNRYLEIAIRNNHAINKKTHLICGKLEEVEQTILGRVNILNISLPCDIHSGAGKSKKQLKQAEESETITSVFGMMNILKAVNPAIVISENVVEARDSASYMMIRAELRRMGYTISETVLDEVQAGSLEARRRYWFVAVSNGIATVDIEHLPAIEKKFKTVADILDSEDAIHIPEFKEYAYLAAKEKRDIEAGNGFRQNLIDGSETRLGVMGKGYAKARGTEPRLKGKSGKSRLLSVDEANRARLIPNHLLGDCGFTIGHEAGGQSILYGHGLGIGRKIAETIQ